MKFAISPLRRLGRAVLAVLVALLSAAAATHSQAQTDPVDQAEACRSLEGGRFQDLPGAPTQVVRATYRPATTESAAVCAVEGYVNPTVNFGLLLPATGWNGKYLVRGCGGSCGSVLVDLACKWHVRDGYACLHTDMGHRSTLSDNNWTANNLQGLVDFGYRATHVTTVAGKAITEAFYSRAPQKSYFFACSTGGRQGLVEAQRFPQDFDGIIAIAPASMAPFGERTPASQFDVDVFNVRADGTSILPNRKALLVHRAVVERCDVNDGVKDGLIGDPRQCKFDPAELQCKGSDTSSCLTTEQVDVVRKIYAGRGAQRGSEFNWIGNYLRNAALPGEKSRAIPYLGDGRGDPTVIDTLNSPNNPDLRPFKARGGKLILVHGWADQSVAPLPTVDYYETVTRTMGGADATLPFARLFMIPGMDHCAGGKGAYAINYMAALEDWVERGQAPDKLVGIHPKPGSPLDYFGTNLSRVDPKHFAFSREHAAYPQRSPVGKVPPPQAITGSLADTLTSAETFAAGSAFPRRSVLNYMLKALWERFDREDWSADQAKAALAAIPTAGLSALARDAVSRMQLELAQN